ncbi:hypothetical protein IKN40_07895, partial [bacterium]|nr:hypothetical protein [bacterium]
NFAKHDDFTSESIIASRIGKGKINTNLIRLIIKVFLTAKKNASEFILESCELDLDKFNLNY